MYIYIYIYICICVRPWKIPGRRYNVDFKEELPLPGTQAPDRMLESDQSNIMKGLTGDGVRCCVRSARLRASPRPQGSKREPGRPGLVCDEGAAAQDLRHIIMIIVIINMFITTTIIIIIIVVVVVVVVVVAVVVVVVVVAVVVVVVVVLLCTNITYS